MAAAKNRAHSTPFPAGGLPAYADDPLCCGTLPPVTVICLWNFASVDTVNYTPGAIGFHELFVNKCLFAGRMQWAIWIQNRKTGHRPWEVGAVLCAVIIV